MKVKQKLGAAKKYVLDRQHFSLRLNQVFSGIVAVSQLEEKEEPAFYTEKIEHKETALHFLFDNGIDPNPEFSGPVKGCLFLEKGNFCLQIEPLPKKDKTTNKSAKTSFRKEILFTELRTLTFLFLTQKDLHFPDTSAKSLNDSLEWRKNWPKEKKGAPSIIKIEFIENISEKEENAFFAFFLPQEDAPITYKEKRIGS